MEKENEKENDKLEMSMFFLSESEQNDRIYF